MIFGVEPTNLAQWGVAGLSTGGGIGAAVWGMRWLIEFAGGRMDKRADRLDADMRFVVEQLKSQIDQLTERSNGISNRLGKVEQDLADCQKKHASSEAEVLKLQAILQGQAASREHAQLIVSAERMEHMKESK
ncbi:hypothetical protein HT578_03705 [Novosphingobium decolorationis]|uniref:Uncharacterized protein n=2 Tax=Novosphingobium decolorationis TaxID=2698673 RepID=A0ABX8E1Z1_9SPHN|nr:hypothetical protein HT578_03705 [Novosphingobium decolorationis]